ncbi:SRPBCC domain-containing protein [Paenibacillus crassostreae]|uniref:Polyketide cyclase n=1 Tax=Paenibacillus crassostreae TaxID=1763538 RepID=A0A167G079_9BACL|nr:SRPBCC domain-containing protein [Paenibacillus crassostreae]AOZ93889.1 polyketide cyclase [Paenibacillus crassostreae]OAB77078.1 polyketide cyclase [Paenibacillus crassostreae]
MKKLEYAFYIGAEPKEVWDVLFDPKLSIRAFMGGVIRSSLKVGDSIEFVGPGKDGDEIVFIYGQLLEYVPHKVLSYTDHPGPTHHVRHAELESRVTLTLDKVGKCTRLHLINDQWTDNHPLYESADQYWWMILSHIKTIVETGKFLDFGY